jgi:hypothetical protein
MDKTSREVARMATNMGVKRARVEGGDPHSRLTGIYKGHSISIVVSTSKGKYDSPGGHALNRTNIKRVIRKIDQTGDIK